MKKSFNNDEINKLVQKYFNEEYVNNIINDREIPRSTFYFGIKNIRMRV